MLRRFLLILSTFTAYLINVLRKLEVSDTYFGDNGEDQGLEHQQCESSNAKEVSSDPFNIYGLLDKRTKEVRTTTTTSIPYPPDVVNSVDKSSSESINNGIKLKEGGSILEISEEMITVGQTMGFSMEGLGSKAKKDWIRELISKHKVSFLSIQETKMESVSAMEVKFLWGNYFFDRIISEACGNSGGILCTWDTNFFKKEQHIISDNFVALYGTWIPNKQKLLLISVYAPQSVSSKRMLWSYLVSLITSWNGESLIMGDFNELEGYSFTWAHPSTTKMSVMVDGDWIDDPDLVKHEFRSHFADRFQDLGSRRVEWFFEHGDFAIGCNSSLVALILKVLDPKVVSDYRPISLIGSLYKVVTKILATRLSLVILDLISDVQTTFLPNRQILDGPFIINENLARCNLKKQQAIFLRSILPRRIFTGFRVDHSITLSHLFYADDAVFIGDNMSSIKGWDKAISKMKKRLSRNFFNGIQDDDRKIAWVKWSKVLASKKYGGLGVSSFYALNRALLFKWVWRYLSHDNSLWSRVISAIHGLNSQVLSVVFNSAWSSIINEVNSLKDK
nr:RNA-directed DNA polymerase, eukaryota [Tanacetum cinerariifolium]